jgi:hypothetical protein
MCYNVCGGHVVKSNFSSIIGLIVLRNEMPNVFQNTPFFLFFSYEGVVILTCTINNHNHCLVF